MTRHQQVSAAGEFGVHLGDEAGHHHGVHVGAGDQQAVDDVR
jgi:hypothetical protein